MINPRESNRFTVSAIFCWHFWHVIPRLKMSSMYALITCPISLREASGPLRSLVNFLGPEHSPFGRQVNWKSRPPKINFKYFWFSSQTGKPSHINLDLSGWMINPRESNRFTVSAIFCWHSWHVIPRLNMSSMYALITCPISLREASGPLRSLVNFLGPEHSPFGRQVNWKSWPSKINFKYFYLPHKQVYKHL